MLHNRRKHSESDGSMHSHDSGGKGDNIRHGSGNESVFSGKIEKKVKLGEALLYYLSTLAVYAVVLLVVIFVRRQGMKYSTPSGLKPMPMDYQILTNVTPAPGDSIKQFRTEVAFDHLRYLARDPHPWNSPANEDTRQYLIGVLKQYQKLAEAQNIKLEIVSADPVAFSTFDDKKKRKTEPLAGKSAQRCSYLESRNVLARVIGKNNKADDALLVSSHIDSVQISYGATDDGINGGVMLEIIRHLIYNPVQSTVVFNFNNGEEIGLYGALGFVNHPWAKTVKAFINMEGAGAGGPAMVFRASNLDVVSRYSKKNSGYITKWRPHANVFANDAFALGLISSDTDYSVYTAYGIPGLDIAFYERRSVYHTSYDNLDNVPAGSIDQIGNTVLNAIKSMADDTEFLAAQRGSPKKPSVYFDILHLSMVSFSFVTLKVLYAVFIALIIAGSVVMFIVSKRSHKNNYYSHSHPGANGHVYFLSILRAFLFSGLALLLVIVVSLCVGLIYGAGNVLAVYGLTALVVTTVTAASLTVIGLVMYLYLVVEDRIGGYSKIQDRFVRSRVMSYAQLYIWLLGLIIGLVMSIAQGIGMLYYTIFASACCIVAALWAYAVEPRVSKSCVLRYVSWLFRLLVAVVLPALLTTDLCSTLVGGLSQTVIDGTKSYFVIVLIGLLVATVFGTSMPFIVTAGRRGVLIGSGVSFLVFIVLLLVSLFITPFSTTNPAHVYFEGTLDLDTQKETIELQSNKKIGGLVNQIWGDIPNMSLSSAVGKKSAVDRFNYTLSAANFGYADAFKSHNIDFPSYNSTKDIPSDFAGSYKNKANGILLYINAPNSQVCEVLTTNTPVYGYAIPQYGDGLADNPSESYTPPVLKPSNNTVTTIDPTFDRFYSYSMNPPVNRCQSLFLLSRASQSQFIVYLEHDGSGFGDAYLQCHYGDLHTFNPYALTLMEKAPSVSATISVGHGVPGSLSVKSKLKLA
ncbi:Vacuolar membrane protease [Zancudomyces culisetae]|uniref:Peptide hydrolase n=1 Tax=Zancudomyces culisetae TaxID=1213189 RepID=A0A1R1PL55_ZANCU|nr:Vacuolar membrane protease [Zancudomyces culisetae]|eukprot:OMH81695.1 Vacuolar membrane protease [Zancudomyces culisetae]